MRGFTPLSGTFKVHGTWVLPKNRGHLPLQNQSTPMKLILPLIVLLLSTQLHLQAQSLPAPTPADSLKTVTIKVKGVTCSSDLKSIASNVEKLSGVIYCKPGKASATSTFEVKYNPAIATEKQLYQAIEDTGGCSDPNTRPYKVKQL